MTPALATSPRQIDREPGARVLRCYVADPDVLARILLLDAIARDPQALVVGATGDERTLLREIDALRPDALFVDARMPSHVPHAVLRRPSGHRCCLIFVGALAADASSAFACDATAFVRRPASRSGMANTLHRVRQHLEERDLLAWARDAAPDRASPRQAAATRAQATESDGMVIVSSRGGTEYIQIAQIVAVVARGDIARILTDSRVIETRLPLADLEQRLGAASFIRTHRGAIVNLRHVCRLDSANAGGGQLLLSSGCAVPVSRRRIAVVRRALASTRGLVVNSVSVPAIPRTR